MKKTFFFLIAILLITGIVWASGTQIITPSEESLYLIASERLSVLTTGVTAFLNLSAAQKAKVRELHVFNTDGATVRWSIDGTYPTTGVTNFSQLTNSTSVVIKGINNITKFRAITDSASGSGSSLYGLFFGK